MIYEYNKNKHNVVKIHLTDNAVIYQPQTGKEIKIPYWEIKKVNLSSFQRGTYICKIVSKNGEKFQFSNQSVTGFAQIDLLNDKYRAFVHELHNRIPIESNVDFVSGSKVIYYFIIIAFPLLAGLVLALIIMYFTGKRRVRVPITAIFILIFIVPVALYMLKTGKGGKYGKNDLPEKYLPCDSCNLNE